MLLNTASRFLNLSSYEVDVISQTVTFNMERDVAEASSGVGFSFSYPYYFSGLNFGGIAEYVDCADRLDPFNGICRGLKVCVTIGTTQEAIVEDLLPGPAVEKYSQPTQAIQFMNDGTCNVVSFFSLTNFGLELNSQLTQ